jgi:hypothetical protein
MSLCTADPRGLHQGRSERVRVQAPPAALFLLNEDMHRQMTLAQQESSTAKTLIIMAKNDID